MLLQISDVIGINIESHLLNKKVMASLLITAAALYGALLHSQGCDAEKINNMRNDRSWRGLGPGARGQGPCQTWFLVVFTVAWRVTFIFPFRICYCQIVLHYSKIKCICVLY